MSSAESTVLTGRRILVVEDEYLLADDIQNALSRLGAEVVGPVPTLNGALELLDAGDSVDAAVLDINLRNEASFPVADSLRARGIPFVFATGYDRAAVPSGYDDVSLWLKPFDPNQLVRTLPSLLQSR
jgi:CheY-like chemotaxis protein